MDHIKDALNSHTLQALPRIIGLLNGERSALAVMANANAVDYRMPWLQGGPLDEAGFRAHVDEGAVRLLREAGSIAILLDNAGEAVVDIAYALLRASQGVRVVLVARSMEYETDVTQAEAKRLTADIAEALGLDPGPVEVLGTGTDYPAPIRSKIHPATAEALDGVDLVISKGIANFEALMEECWPSPDRVIVALKAKCPPVARELGVGLGDAVAKLGYRCRLRG
ncbi:MAG: ARMT1-like domain-containing protein [Desulfurococcales archaeon]|nr:ARMT1-like domain-containing protein [Desulfurococcales archaeon]